MRGVAAYPAQHCLRLGFLGAGVAGGGEGKRGGSTHGLGVGKGGVRGSESQPAAPPPSEQECSSVSQPFSSCRVSSPPPPTPGDVTSCLEHPGSTPLEKGISWARLPRPCGGDALPHSLQHHPERPWQRGLAAAWVVGSLPWAWAKT